jgi:hypothetical protein
MKFLMENSGYIILGICAVVVLAGKGSSSGRTPPTERDLADEAWLHSKENPDNEDKFPLG